MHKRNPLVDYCAEALDRIIACCPYIQIRIFAVSVDRTQIDVYAVCNELLDIERTVDKANHNFTNLRPALGAKCNFAVMQFRFHAVTADTDSKFRFAVCINFVIFKRFVLCSRFKRPCGKRRTKQGNGFLGLFNHGRPFTEAAQNMIERVGAFYDLYIDLGKKLKAVHTVYNSGISKLKPEGQSITTSAKQVIAIGAKRSKGKEFVVPEEMLTIEEEL